MVGVVGLRRVVEHLVHNFWQHLGIAVPSRMSEFQPTLLNFALSVEDIARVQDEAIAAHKKVWCICRE